MTAINPILPGRLLWSGEHWICFLRAPGTGKDTARVSLYRSHYSPAGEGHVAFVAVPGRLEAILTDNRAFLEFVRETMFRGKASPFAPCLPVVDADFRRGGELSESPSWNLETRDHHLNVTWTRLEPPAVAYRDDPELQSRRPVFTVLFFCRDALVLLDGRRIDGAPYPRSIWREALGGGDRSSCVFAIAETMIRPTD
ncbi:MAG: hypothetical protein OXH11_19705 [Candidatus Aminicenantes bacterium]|nr:hypothetical protein [Candidatus Aminicenantes bacterium]